MSKGNRITFGLEYEPLKPLLSPSRADTTGSLVFVRDPDANEILSEGLFVDATEVGLGEVWI
jgi:hypothetical protein